MSAARPRRAEPLRRPWGLWGLRGAVLTYLALMIAVPLLLVPAAGSELDERLADLVVSPFRPENEPVLRTAILHGERTMLLFVSHAVACDRRSMEILNP